MDELATTIAAALVTKGADAVIASGKSAIEALVRLLRTRFGEGTREGALIRAVGAHPDDAALQNEFSRALARAMAHDPAFRDQVLRYWRRVETDRSKRDGLNHFSGAAAKVVQARDIHGDVTL